MIRKYFLYLLAIPKTLIFNFWYFPLSIAVKLPVIVSHRVWLMKLAGEVVLQKNKIQTGMIKLGFGEVGIFDQHRSRTIWQVSGTVKFGGRARIGHGSKIVVGKAGCLILGDGFAISAEGSIVVMDRVEIGTGVLISWDVLILDTDFHSIFDCANNHLNPNSPVIIGNDVWIGCRALILKGSNIPNGVVIAAATTVSKKMYEKNLIIGGNPVRVLKENINWKS